MEYSVEEFKELALGEGFTNAGQLNTKALVFMPEVRQMCRADKCHSYGKSWRCPPACGSLEDAAALAAQYSFGMIVQTVGHMEDEFDFETIERAGKEHADSFVSIMRKLKAKYPDVLGMGAGTCKRCKTCTYPDAPCRFPDKAIPSVEACGINVVELAAKSGLRYNNGPCTVTYFCLILIR